MPLSKETQQANEERLGRDLKFLRNVDRQHQLGKITDAQRQKILREFFPHNDSTTRGSNCFTGKPPRCFLR